MRVSGSKMYYFSTLYSSTLYANFWLIRFKMFLNIKGFFILSELPYYIIILLLLKNDEESNNAQSLCIYIYMYYTRHTYCKKCMFLGWIINLRNSLWNEKCRITCFNDHNHSSTVWNVIKPASLPLYLFNKHRSYKNLRIQILWPDKSCIFFGTDSILPWTSG